VSGNWTFKSPTVTAFGRCTLGLSASSSCAARSLSVCSCILDPCAIDEMLELILFSSLLVRDGFFSPSAPTVAPLSLPHDSPDAAVSRLVVDMLRVMSGLDMADDGAGGGATRLSDLRRANGRHPPSTDRRAKLNASPRAPWSRFGELGVLWNDVTDAERMGWKDARRKDVAELARWWYAGGGCGLEWNSACRCGGVSTVTTDSASGALSLCTMVVRTDMASDFGVTATLPPIGVLGTFWL
jgi:hypothetical protein